MPSKSVLQKYLFLLMVGFIYTGVNMGGLIAKNLSKPAALLFLAATWLAVFVLIFYLWRKNQKTNPNRLREFEKSYLDSGLLAYCFTCNQKSNQSGTCANCKSTMKIDELKDQLAYALDNEHKIGKDRPWNSFTSTALIMNNKFGFDLFYKIMPTYLKQAPDRAISLIHQLEDRYIAWQSDDKIWSVLRSLEIVGLFTIPILSYSFLNLNHAGEVLVVPVSLAITILMVLTRRDYCKSLLIKQLKQKEREFIQEQDSHESSQD